MPATAQRETLVGVSQAADRLLAALHTLAPEKLEALTGLLQSMIGQEPPEEGANTMTVTAKKLGRGKLPDNAPDELKQAWKTRAANRTQDKG